MMADVPYKETQEEEGEFLLDGSAPLVMALDIGTSSVRAALYDETGSEIIGTQARSLHELCTTIDGGAQIDAEDFVEQVAHTIDEALAQVSSPAGRIETVALSSFWHSLVGVDSRGHAVTPVLGWADTRAARESEDLRRRLDERKVHARTGAPFHPSYWPAKLLWLERSQPKTYKRVARWMSFDEFLAQRLLGRAQASVSMASGTGLLNVHTCAWDEELCRELKIGSEMLPVVAATHQASGFPTDQYAQRWPQLSGALWFPAIGDGAANNIGAGCTSSKRVALMIGTSGAMRVLYEGEPPRALPTGLWCYRADRKRVCIGGALSDGGGLWAWMNEALSLNSDAEEIEREIATMQADAHGLTILPFWAGERSTGWHTSARGAILGLSMHTRAPEIQRAAMEAVAYRFHLIAEALDGFAPGAEIHASGGALQSSPAWTQIIADVLGRPLYVSGAAESSSRGAVLLALEARCKIKSIGEERAPVARIVEPDMIRHARYLQGLERQQKLYERLVGDEETTRLINEASLTVSEDASRSGNYQ